MGLLYAWATPEHLLWNMTIGQVIMLHNRGVEIKYPKPNKPGERSYEELAEAREDIRRMFPELRDKYGDVDGDAG